MKKAICFILMAAMALSMLSGCSLKKKTFRVGIVQIVQHASLDAIRTSMIKELEAKGYTGGKNVDIDYRNANGDQNTLTTICQQFVSRKCDLIIAIATPSAQAAAAATKTIPILYVAVSDPFGAGLIKDQNHPGGNITGTTDRIDVSKIFAVQEKLTPSKKTIGVLYNAGETNSVSEVKSVKQYASEHGLNIVESTVANASEVRQAADSLIGRKVDSLFVPIDNTVASAMASVATAARSAKIPVYVSAESNVKDGGLATSGVSDEDIGTASGDMAAQIIEGKKPGDMAAQFVYNTHICINKATADAIGVKIPDDLAKSATIIGQ